jgi:chromosome segregation ATPase
MYRDLSALLAAKELDLEVANAKVAELRARVEELERGHADASAPTNRDAVLEGAVKRSEDLARENRHLAGQLFELRERRREQSSRVASLNEGGESIARALSQIGETIGRLFKR